MNVANKGKRLQEVLLPLSQMDDLREGMAREGTGEADGLVLSVFFMANDEANRTLTAVRESADPHDAFYVRERVGVGKRMPPPPGRDEANDRLERIQRDDADDPIFVYEADRLPIYPPMPNSTALVVASARQVMGCRPQVMFAFIVPVDECTVELACTISSIVDDNSRVYHQDTKGNYGIQCVIPMTSGRTNTPRVFLCPNPGTGTGRSLWWPFVFADTFDVEEGTFGDDPHIYSTECAPAIQRVLCGVSLRTKVPPSTIRRYLYAVDPLNPAFSNFRCYPPFERHLKYEHRRAAEWTPGELPETLEETTGNFALEDRMDCLMDSERCWPIRPMPDSLFGPVLLDDGLYRFLRQHRHRINLTTSRVNGSNAWSMLPPEVLRDYIDPMIYRAPSAGRKGRATAASSSRSRSRSRTRERR